jgi:hypothetical protein
MNLFVFLGLSIRMHENQMVRMYLIRFFNQIDERNLTRIQSHIKVSFLILDWDETAPRDIIDKNAKIPDGWLENGKISNKF